MFIDAQILKEASLLTMMLVRLRVIVLMRYEFAGAVVGAGKSRTMCRMGRSLSACPL